MFKTGDEVVIVNKKWKNNGKSAIILLINDWDGTILIKTCETGWVKWCTRKDIEPTNKPSAQVQKVKVSPNKIVPFIALPCDDNNLTKQSIRSKIEKDHDDTTVMFGDTFENMKDKIIASINDAWGYEEWDNIYVVSGEDYFRISREVVMKKL